MSLITLTSTEELYFIFSVLGGSLLRVSSSSWWLPVFSSLFWLVRSYVNMCWILSKASCWALEVCSWASLRWRRSSSLLLSAMLADRSNVSHQADGSRRGIATSFLFIIGPLKKVSQWCRWYSPCWERRLSIDVGYCYPIASTLEGTLLFHQYLT